MRKNILWMALWACLFVSGESRAESLEIEPGWKTSRINTMLNRAKPGDTLHFLPGQYTGPFVLEGVNGSPNMPVVITGIRKHVNEGSVIDGKTDPGIDLSRFAFRLKECSWISIEWFTIRNCWTDLIHADNSSYLSLRFCHMTGGKRALFATGRGSHHFLVEHCRWEQDERVWTQPGDYTWEEIHHGIHRHYNGSIFQGSGISGGFILRDNIIYNTFNAFRLSQINRGVYDPMACSNGEIYRNTIHNTSDNVLEPEVHAHNLHYYHNRMVNGHAFISITEVRGGNIFIYGNTAVSLPDSEDGWTVFKISSRQDTLTAPLYIYNNSWQVDFDIIGSPRHVWENDHLRHFNNAVVSEVSDSFGIYNLGLDNRFDYDCSNVPFPELLTANGMERQGIVADPGFGDPYGGDFRLNEGSPCIDAGRKDDWLIPQFRGKAPDMGAYDNGELVAGPPFRYSTPPEGDPVEEHPRITRHRISGSRITLWFSAPLDPASVRSTRIRITSGTREFPAKFMGLQEDGYRVELELEGSLPGPADGLLVSRWPVGANGLPCTSWGSSLPVRKIPE